MSLHPPAPPQQMDAGAQTAPAKRSKVNVKKAVGEGAPPPPPAGAGLAACFSPFRLVNRVAVAARSHLRCIFRR